MSAPTIHASCVAFGDLGVLLRGPSGAGKSDLAFRLIENGARLVADDRVILGERDGTVFAAPPDTLAGLLELRGIGLVRFPPVFPAAVRLVCDLVAPDAIERLPQPSTCAYLGVRISCLAIDPFEAAAVGKLRIAVQAAAGRADPVTGAQPSCDGGHCEIEGQATE